jgi:hypothetical protein
MRLFRLLVGIAIAVAAAAVAIVAGGWAPILLGLIAGLIVADALVADFHAPLFRELPESKRRRLRRR